MRVGPRLHRTRASGGPATYAVTRRRRKPLLITGTGTSAGFANFRQNPIFVSALQPLLRGTDRRVAFPPQSIPPCRARLGAAWDGLAVKLVEASAASTSSTTRSPSESWVWRQVDHRQFVIALHAKHRLTDEASPHVPQGSPAKTSLQDVAASLMNSAMQHIATFLPESASARRC